MILARIVGTVVATRKDERLVSNKLLIARPTDPRGKPEGTYVVAVDTVDAGVGETGLLVLQPIAAGGEPSGRTLVALDSVGAGVGEHVFFVRGREAAFPFYPAEPPTDAAIVGIVDHWDVGG